MADVSHTGTIVTVSASNTTGGAPVPITAFPKDTDPFDIPDMDIADAEVGTNGDLISWDVANPIEISMAVIPVTDDYEFLVTLLNLNRAEKNKNCAEAQFFFPDFPYMGPQGPPIERYGAPWAPY